MDRRDTLIAEATAMVRKGGYAGFSYADLSDVVGIRKASIHHHFPGKVDLGLAMVEAYRDTFARQLMEISGSEATCAGCLERYAGLYRAALDTGSGCLCGVLAAEFAGLPPPVQAAVRGFFDDNVSWLETVIRDRNGAVDDGSNRKVAQMSLATLQGAVLTARAQDDVGIFDTAAATLIATICR